MKELINYLWDNRIDFSTNGSQIQMRYSEYRELEKLNPEITKELEVKRYEKVITIN